MKANALLAVASAILFLVSCNDTTTPIPGPGYSKFSLSGKWSCVYSHAWRDTSHVSGTDYSMTYPVGLHYYNFTSDTTYDCYSNGTFYMSGEYRIDSASGLFINGPGPCQTELFYRRPNYNEFWIRSVLYNEFQPGMPCVNITESKYVRF